MRYVTPRKAARGLGAAGPSTGTAQHWSMTVSSVALLMLTPAFVFVIASAIGLPHHAVVAYFSQPYPALVTALFLIVGMLHYVNGTRIMIDDYAANTERRVAMIAVQLFGWAVIAAVVYALARMALSPAVGSITTVVVH